MKTILIISYHFPPDAAVGALRPAKFAKYLPQFDWTPIILTVKDRHYSVVDQSKLKDVGSVREVYRTNLPPHLSTIYVNLKTRLSRALRHPQLSGQPRAAAKQRTFLSFLRNAYLSLEGLPDDKHGWILRATSVGLKIILRQKVDAILTTGPPMSCHVIGLLLKALTGQRWIADFRDPWLSHRLGVAHSTGLSRAIETWLERKTLRHADKVVLATDRMQADLHQRHSGITAKTAVILNGYDPTDFNGAPVCLYHANRQHLTLTHAGTIYYHRSAEPFLGTHSVLSNGGWIPRSRVRVNFIGESPGILERARHLGIDDVVTVSAAMNYQRCIEWLYRSDVLLLFAQNQPLQIPAKFYDYIAVR